MAEVFYDRDIDLAPLLNRTVAVVGYGSQGAAQAQNLRDAGIRVVVGLRPGGPSWQRARDDGFEVLPVAEAAARADVIHLLVPDEHQRDVYERQVRDQLKPGKALGFSHGFNIHYGQIVPPPTVDVFLVAPKAPGRRFRELVAAGQGVPGLVAVHQDATGQAWPLALAFAKAVGCARAGVIRTTFAEETETDLFGEQAVLCGGVAALVQAGFETLVEAGYQPEVAYFECLHELKLIVDLIYEGGITHMRENVSPTARYGDVTRGPRVIGPAVREAMRAVLEEVRSGAFAREWVLENQSGRPVFRSLLRRGAEHPIEEVGRRLRAMMAWLPQPRAEAAAD